MAVVAVEDPAVMTRHNGLGRGKADSIAAGAAGPGGVRPVKAVEVAGQLPGIQPGAGIGDREDHPPPPSGQGQADGAARIAVLYGVVQQDGQQPKQVVGNTLDLDAVGDLRGQGLPRRLRLPITDSRVGPLLTPVRFRPIPTSNPKQSWPPPV